MKTLRRFNRFTDRHPLFSIALGMLLIVIAGMVILPPDPPNLGAPTSQAAN